MTLPIVRAYNGLSGEFIEDWLGEDTTHHNNPGTVEIHFSSNAPDTARIEIPGCAPYLHRSRLSPEGVGVFVEIDARELGVPGVWTGRALAPQFGGAAPHVSLQLKGPEEWLSEAGLVEGAQTYGPSIDVVKRLFRETPAETFTVVDPSSEAQNQTFVDFANAQDIWSTITSLAEQRGESFWLAATPGEVGYSLTWQAGSYAVDMTGMAMADLVAGDNCELGNSASAFGTPPDKLTMIAQSYGFADDFNAASAAAPDGLRPLGLREAYELNLSAAPLRRLNASQGGRAIPAPEVYTQSVIQHTVAEALRRAIIPTVLCQVVNVDCSAWPYMRPGNLVNVRMDDPTGYFEDSIGRITETTFSVTEPLGCNVNLELWAVC